MLREERSREANGWEHNLELLRIMLGRLGKLNKTSSFRLKPYGIIFYFLFTYPFILTADLPYFNSFCPPKGLFVQRTLEKLIYYFWSLKSDYHEETKLIKHSIYKISLTTESSSCYANSLSKYLLLNLAV